MPAPAVTLLTNFVPPYLVSFYAALQKRVSRFRILVSTPMEENRSWPFQGDDLPVSVQRAITLRRTWRHPHGFAEPVSLHLPIDTLGQLWRNRPDVIVTTEFGLRTLQALVYAALRPRTRVVLWALVTETLELGRGRFRETLRRWMLRCADAVVVSGASGARYVAGLGFPDASIFRVPPYAPRSDAPSGALRPRTGRECRRLLYVGRLADGKGLVPWIALLARWAERHPDRAIELWIVGEGPARAAIEACAVPANVALRCFGSVPYERLADLYAQAGILVFPTLADEWGVVVNEAFAAGVPVLGSVYSQAVEDVVEDGRTGWVFRPDREDEAASALDRALGTPIEALDAMREACLERAEAFTAESASRGMFAAIDHAARGERRARRRGAAGARLATTGRDTACPLCGHASTGGPMLPHAEVRRCSAPGCGLDFADPQPDDAALREAYRTLYYPAQAASDAARAAIVDWDETPPGTLRELMAAIAPRLRADGAPRLLDYGCGRGALARVAREAGFAVVGIEIDAEARRACERDAGLRVHPDLAALRRDAPDARFDVIAIWQVIEHLRRPWDDLAALRGMLAPGGLLVVATPNANGLRARVEGARWENVANPTHLYYFTERSLRRVLQASGFETAERLRIPEAYPHHGPLRRAAQRLLRACDLEGDVVLVARRPRARAGDG